MRVLAITIMLLLAMVGTVHATMQDPDMIIYLDKKTPLEGAPLGSYQWPGGKRPAFTQDSSANYRGYIASWEIINDKLYLVDIDAIIAVNAREYYENWKEYNKNGEFLRVGVADLFPQDVKDGKVFASWYSGVLRIGAGEVVASHPFSGFGLFYSREIFLTIDKGIVLNTCIKKNTHDSVWEELRKSREEGRRSTLLTCP